MSLLRNVVFIPFIFIQIICALTHSAGNIITSNKNDFASSFSAKLNSSTAPTFEPTSSSSNPTPLANQQSTIKPSFFTLTSPYPTFQPSSTYIPSSSRNSTPLVNLKSPTFQPTLSYVPYSRHPTPSANLYSTSQPLASEVPTISPSISPGQISDLQLTCNPTPIATNVPYRIPTCQPFVKLTPSFFPTIVKSSIPTQSPIFRPSASPSTSAAPTISRIPLLSTSKSPIWKPTRRPTYLPSSVPTARPTSHPSPHPTSHPTSRPTSHPSPHPTSHPTSKPSPKPTSRPSPKPSPSPTPNPTFKPTKQPIPKSTRKPTKCPTAAPSEEPSTIIPTQFPTFEPTLSPSIIPSTMPTPTPTAVPTISPSLFPSEIPTISPTFSPSFISSVTPSISPSSLTPTLLPTTEPTGFPSPVPSTKPTLPPISALVSQIPSVSITSRPTTTASPSFTANPSTRIPTAPTQQPVPTLDPSFTPSSAPSPSPTVQPSYDSSAYLSITANGQVVGVSASMLNASASAKSIFVATVASSLSKVTAADVSILSISPDSKSSNRRSLGSSQLSATVRFQVLQQLNSAESGVNATALYKSQSQQLLQQVSSGGFTSTMQMKARTASPPEPLLLHANCSTVAVDPFAGVIFITSRPSLTPSLSPATIPISSASKTSSSSYDSWPLYGQVLLPLGIVLLVLIGVVVGVALYTRQQNQFGSLKSLIYSDKYKPAAPPPPPLQDQSKPDISDLESVIVGNARDTDTVDGRDKDKDNDGWRDPDRFGLKMSTTPLPAEAPSMGGSGRSRTPISRAGVSSPSAEALSRASGRKHRARPRTRDRDRDTPGKIAQATTSASGKKSGGESGRSFISGDFL